VRWTNTLPLHWLHSRCCLPKIIPIRVNLLKLCRKYFWSPFPGHTVLPLALFICLIQQKNNHTDSTGSLLCRFASFACKAAAKVKAAVRRYTSCRVGPIRRPVGSARIAQLYGRPTGWLKKVSCRTLSTAYFFEPPCIYRIVPCW